MKKHNWIIAVLSLLCFLFCLQDLLFAGDTSNKRFLQKGEVILDTQTGLMWPLQDNGFDINWFEAKKFCREFKAGGFDDWRMPTQKELETIYYQDPKSNDMYSVAGGIQVTACCLWASDTKDPKVASFDFDYGNPDWGHPNSTVEARVIPVRTKAKK